MLLITTFLPTNSFITFTIKKGKTSLLAAKIDLYKAYDKLDWSFIKFALRFYHFPDPIIDLILACISSSTVSILWNGVISSPFKPNRGIRQGNPLTPYLFILCLNHLSLALDQTLHTKHLSPIRLGRRPIGFNHVLFADDIFLFSQATLHDSRILFYIFAQFCQRSGQICNLSKSKIFFSRNATPEILHQIAVLTNMPIVTDLGKYQGLPLILNSTSNSMFQPLLDRIRDRIRAWQSKLLSQAGRITLIKAVLSPITFYAMQTTHIPKGVLDHMNKLIRGFLCGNTATQKHDIC